MLPQVLVPFNISFDRLLFFTSINKYSKNSYFVFILAMEQSV